MGLLHWALIVSGPHWLFAAYGWALFVAITLWLLTIILFFFILFGVLQKLPALPWSLVVRTHTADTLTHRILCTLCFIKNMHTTGISTRKYCKSPKFKI